MNHFFLIMPLNHMTLMTLWQNNKPRMLDISNVVQFNEYFKLIKQLLFGMFGIFVYGKNCSGILKITF